ncbi:18516_t:CDS:2 [Funneliformis geosporum]|uniref:tRNA pseudouridine(55) synthase n=1 Tax=Funneliformis geosporum TaxID=1117311 RepID=A0A9W4SJS2_9GLOM|nr:18516_t:CDS:2 [Funneliformis geosporum]CAI2171961.1 326_t:CDS:2 [Funneliformis geosporum]
MIPNGLFAVNKPSGPLSVTILDKIKRIYRLQRKEFALSHRNKLKLGHGGTLDPLASGVLVIGVNDGCKRLHEYIKCNKIYEAVGMLGFATDTYDSEGKIIATGPTEHITKEDISQLTSKFIGDIMQIPPMYSALRIDGRRLYDYARKGLILPRKIQARSIRIDSLSLLGFTTNHDFRIPKTDAAITENKYVEQASYPIFKIRVDCGSGTYIRSLIHDIGKELGSAAHVVQLKRLQQGNFMLEKNTLEWNESLTLTNIFEAIKSEV